MIEAHQLIPYRVSSDDYILTEQLKTHFAQMKQERCPMYLTLDEFDRVIQWKYVVSTEDSGKDAKRIRIMGWPVQEVDLAIWRYDRVNGGRAIATTAACAST